MGKRIVRITTLFLLMGALLAAPASAKCCPLDRIEVSGPDIDGTVTIRAEELEQRLRPGQLIDLYWPALHGLFKGDERPVGNLGPAYELSYILERTEDVEPVVVRETVHLYAEEPVAYTHEDQTHELYPGDVREVTWGWRPFPDQAANALISMLDEPRMVSLQGEVVDGTTRSWPSLIAGATAGALIAIGGVWFFLRRPSEGPAAT